MMVVWVVIGPNGNHGDRVVAVFDSLIEAERYVRSCLVADDENPLRPATSYTIERHVVQTTQVSDYVV